MTRTAPPEWRVFTTSNELCEAVAHLIIETLQPRLKQGHRVHMVVPGGRSPQPIFKLLRSSVPDWSQIEIYPSDERALPRNHPERNDLMIRSLLQGEGGLPAANFHPIPAELGAVAAAVAYHQLLQSRPPFDIALLGMGEDGHTASLFPDNPALSDPAEAVAVFAAPKPPPERVSLGLQRLQQARLTILLATGAGKQTALQQIRQGIPLPAAQVGADLCFCDQAAWGDDPV
ncbi:MAG: 6-phosphogluconolactonase [Gammaproteobacteria bacterium]|nr:6-phosphogluconolactonase [Gammaproteobacteria bacterium]